MMYPKLAPWFITMLTSQMASHRPDLLASVQETPLSELLPSYDFIIVGGGTSGSVIANRLSEVDNWKVLLIEAGSTESVTTSTPILLRETWGSQADWNFTSIPQQSACRAMNGSCYFPQGHVIGGSSNTNWMMYIRGTKTDFNKWEEEGNVGWGYDSVMPYYLKSEDMTINDLQSSSFHAKGGSLKIGYSNYHSAMQDKYMEAAKSLGYSQVDYNGGSQVGIGYPQLTISEGSRCNSAKAFLSPLKERKNLHILLDSHVTKIIIHPKRKTIEGVEFKKNDKIHRVNATKEIILAAGVFNSPKLLMLSGIGPKPHLKEMNIPVLVNSPVGNNFQNHITVPLYYKVDKNMPLLKSMVENEDSVNEYAQNKSGPLTSPVGVEAIGFLRFDGNSSDSIGDFQIVMASYMPCVRSNPFIMLASTILRPESKGSVKLKSKNIEDQPIIDPQFFSKKKDFEDSVAACLSSMDIMKSKVMIDAAPELDTAWAAECKDSITDETKLCTCLVEKYAFPMFNGIGTNIMGHPKKSKKSVVCPQLRVHGVKGLRVADSSVMPHLINGDTQATVIMIGEMASDFIKKEWLKDTP